MLDVKVNSAGISLELANGFFVCAEIAAALKTMVKINGADEKCN